MTVPKKREDYVGFEIAPGIYASGFTETVGEGENTTSIYTHSPELPEEYTKDKEETPSETDPD